MKVWTIGIAGAAIALALLAQGFLEAAQDFGVGELTLGKPRRGHDAQALAQHAELLRRSGDHYNGLLHRRPRDVRGPREELRGIYLPRAGDAEEGCGGRGSSSWAEEGEVGEVFGGASCRQSHILVEGRSKADA